MVAVMMVMQCFGMNFAMMLWYEAHPVIWMFMKMEINLLKNLSHANIVKYIDAIRSDGYLNIVLEFVENGTLSNLLGKLLKHGNVEEQLVAVYTIQILDGLKYLHQQGQVQVIYFYIPMTWHLCEWASHNEH